MTLFGWGFPLGRPFDQTDLLLWLEFDAAHVGLDVGVETAISRDPLRRELTQASDGSQPDHTVDDYQTNDHASIALPAGEFLQSTDAASVWNHHGSGNIAGLIAGIPSDQDGNLIGTVIGPAGEGWQIRLESGEIHLRIENSAAGVTTLAVPYEANVPTTIRWFIGAAGTARLEAQDQVDTATGITLSSSGAPETTLRIGDPIAGTDLGKWNLFVLWADEDADSDLRAEYYARDKFWCEYGIDSCETLQRSDRGVGFSTPPSVNAWDSHRGEGIDFTGSGILPLAQGNDATLGSRTSIVSGAGAAKLEAALSIASGADRTVVWTGYHGSGDGPHWSLEDVAADDRQACGINSAGYWVIFTTSAGTAEEITDSVAADFLPHTFVYTSKQQELFVREMYVDNMWVASDGSGDGLSVDTDVLFASDVESDESNFVLGRRATFSEKLSDWAIKVATWAQRDWARMAQLSESITLPELAASEGAVLFASMLDSAGYALSGSDIVSIEEQIQGDTIAASGNPQFSATGFNGGPGAVHDGTGDWFIGNNATIVSALADDSACTWIVAGVFDVADRNSALFGWGRTDQALNGSGWWGQSATGAGRWRITHHDDSGASVSTDSAADNDTDPHVFRVTRHGDGTISMWVDGTLVMDGVAHASGTSTPDQWAIGVIPRSTPVITHRGAWAVQALFPDAGAHATFEQAVADAVGVTLS